MNDLESRKDRAFTRKRIGRALMILPLFLGSMMILFAFLLNIHNLAFVVIGFVFMALGGFLYISWETA